MPAPRKTGFSAAAGSAANELGFERDPVSEVIRTYSAYVASLAYRLLGRDDEVDDVVQDVFLTYFRFRDSIRDPSAVRAWLATTTVRTVRKRLRLRRIGLLLGWSDQADPSDLTAFSASPEDAAVLSSIQRVLERINVSDRIAWVLRYLEQERVEDVAAICGCSLATAKRRISAAQHVVRRALGDD